MATFEELIAGARAEGVLDSTGAFTLDREKAREKMRHFQLADPRAYVVELLQAAVLVGATKVDVELDADDMHMRFDGRSFDREDLDMLYGALFSRDDSGKLAARRQLALGLNAAMGIGPRYVRFTSGALHMKLVPDKPDQITEAETPVEGTEIHVRDRFRGQTLVRFVRQIGGTLAEAAHLIDRCGYVQLKLSINGKPFALKQPFADAGVRAEFSEPGLRGVAAFGAELGQGLRFTVLKHGVVITRFESTAFPTGFGAVFEADAVRKDISQTALVRDANWARALSGVKRAVWPLLAELAERAGKDFDTAQLFRSALLHRSTIPEMRRVASATLRGKAPDARLAAIAAVPLWPSAIGPRSSLPAPRLQESGLPPAAISLADMIRAQVTFGSAEYVGVSMFSGAPWPADRPVPLIKSDSEQAYLARVLGRPLREVTDDLVIASERVKNVARWRTRAMAPHFELPRSDFVAVPLHMEGVTGEVGLHLKWNAETAFWLIKEGCLLEPRRSDGLLPGFMAVLEADFTPSARHDRVQNDQIFLRIALEIMHVIPQLLTELSLPEHSSLRAEDRESALRRVLVPFLALDFERDGLARWLAMWGIQDEQALTDARNLLRERPPPLIPTFEILKSDAAPSYVRIALFDTVGGPRVSLLGIAEEIATSGALAYVHRKLVTTTRATSRMTVVASDSELGALKRVFGARRLRDLGEDYLTAEALARHLRHAPVPIALDTTGIANRRFESEGMSGHVCLLSPELPAVQVFAHVRLLKHERPFGAIRFAAPIGPIVAVVNDDALEPNSDWTGASDNARLGLVRARVLSEAVQLIIGLGHEAALGHRMLLLNVAARIHGGKHTREPWAQELVMLLERTPLLFESSGTALTFEQIRADVKRHGSVLYVRDHAPLSVDRSRMILKLDLTEQFVLEAVLGSAALLPGEVWLIERAHLARLRAAPPLARIALEAKRTLVRVSVNTARVRGEVGLVRLPTSSTLQLRLCHDRRVLATVEASSPLALAAILEDDALPLHETGIVNLQSGRQQELAALAIKRVPELIARLLNDVSVWFGDDRQSALRHVVDYLVSESDRSDTRSPKAEAVYQRVRRHPLFTGIAGTYSFEQLLSSYERFSEQAYLPFGLAGKQLDETRIVLIASPPERMLLLRLFPTLRDYTADWAHQQMLGQALEDAVPLPKRPDDALEARSGAIREGLSADLWLPADGTTDLRCAVGAYGRTIAQVAISPLFPCSGRVEGEGFVVGHGAWPQPRSVVLTTPQRTSLERLSFRLYDQLAKDLYRPSAGRALQGARADAARRLLQQAARAYAALPDPLALDADYRAFFESLAGPPLAGGAQPTSPDASEGEREAALVRGLRDALRWASDQHASMLDTLNLERIALGVLPETLIAQCRAHGVTINRRHPLVRALLTAQAHDPVLLAWLASSAYTAMNHFWLEIEDDHEREFCSVLLDEVIDAPAAQR